MESDSEEELFAVAINNERTLIAASVLSVAADDLSSQFHEEDKRYVDHLNEVRNVLNQISTGSSLFRNITNFKPVEFEELCGKVFPELIRLARTMGDYARGSAGRPYKLTAEQRVLSTIMYLKHDNTVVYDAMQLKLTFR
ncbi:hypothetical protein R1flu_022990 [Riccia fluitans]|uniref:Uncharacterized protein n=1 Tax=Riccia fluitans TaxID=41844 RepID=A0ABD1XRG4_9MARC